MFGQDFTCPVLLDAGPPTIFFGYGAITPYGRPFQDRSPKNRRFVTSRAAPRSLATTRGLSVDFFSSGS
jgi:hypothetical protein